MTDLERIFAELNETFLTVGATDDWLMIKKNLMLRLPPRLRKLFSVRDQKTKLHETNDFENKLISDWEMLSGIRPFIPEEKRSKNS